VRAFETTEKRRKEEIERTMKAHKESLEKQMQNTKAKDKGMAPQEYMLNK
jgi:hypothetical protein